MHWTLLLLILNQQNDQHLNPFPLKSNSVISQKEIRFELQWNFFQVSNFSMSNYPPLKTFLQVNHFKRYQTAEEQRRRKFIFFETLLEIESHNERYFQGLETFQMGVNQFSDMTDEEFEQIYARNDFLNIPVSTNKSISSHPVTIKAHPDKDPNWYTPLIPVKDQGRCGACWTLVKISSISFITRYKIFHFRFATTGLLEYDYFHKRGGEVISLSEQELLDCVPKMNYGCNGGVPYYALEFVKEIGINYEEDYPYKTRQTKCQIRLKKAPKFVQNVEMTPKSEKAIYEHLFYSPVIVGVYLNQKVWKNYKSGYISARKCKRQKINHAVS